MATPLKRLLAVSWAMPPMLFPRSIQVSRALNALMELGWEITVVCNDPGESGGVDISLGGMPANRCEMVRVPMGSSDVPDDALMSNWLEPAVRSVKKRLAARKYSAFITFAQPWVDHLIGLKARPSNMPWIAHFSDPWVDSPYYAAFGEEQLERWRNMERAVMQHADAILFTNEQAVELVMNKYPRQWQEKTRVIPHAFDETIPILQKHQPGRGSRLQLLYTGDLYKGRSAEGLLKALVILAEKRPLAKEVEVKMMGRISADEIQMAQSLGLQDVVEFADQIPYMQSLQKCAQCDVLLLIDAPTSMPSPFLPSKLVDYLVFRKPIFALTANGGASADLLHRLGFSTVPPDDVPAIAAALNNLLDAWRSGTLTIPAQYEQVASQYGARHVGAQLDCAIQNAISSRPQRPWWQMWR